VRTAPELPQPMRAEQRRAQEANYPDMRQPANLPEEAHLSIRQGGLSLEKRPPTNGVSTASTTVPPTPIVPTAVPPEGQRKPAEVIIDFREFVTPKPSALDILKNVLFYSGCFAALRR